MAQQPNVFTTPKGVALYPWLSTPDTKFNEEGEYKVSLVLSKADAQPLIDQINAIFADNLKEEMKKQKGKELKTANPPYTDQLDDAGQPTGNVILRFKSKAVYKPAIFDAKGNVVVDSNIWAGSEIRVNGSIAPYYTSMVGAGVALRLRAVQIITLVEGSSSADRFGFEETTGYVHNEGAEVFETDAATQAVSATPNGLASAGGWNPTLEKPEVAEPEVIKTAPTNDGSKDIADIVSKWGAKD